MFLSSPPSIIFTFVAAAARKRRDEVVLLFLWSDADVVSIMYSMWTLLTKERSYSVHRIDALHCSVKILYRVFFIVFSLCQVFTELSGSLMSLKCVINYFFTHLLQIHINNTETTLLWPYHEERSDKHTI